MSDAFPTFSMGEPAEDFDMDKALAIAAALEDEETARKLAESSGNVPPVDAPPR